jgi:hypothetical protein
VLTSAYDEKLVRSTVGAAQACGFVRNFFQIEDWFTLGGVPSPWASSRVNWEVERLSPGEPQQMRRIDRHVPSRQSRRTSY